MQLLLEDGFLEELSQESDYFLLRAAWRLSDVVGHACVVLLEREDVVEQQLNVEVYIQNRQGLQIHEELVKDAGAKWFDRFCDLADDFACTVNFCAGGPVLIR